MPQIDPQKTSVFIIILHQNFLKVTAAYFFPSCSLVIAEYNATNENFNQENFEEKS